MDIKPENNPDSLEDIHSSFRFLKESINNLSTDRDTDQNPDSDFQSSFQALRQKIFSLATTIDTKLRDSTLVPDVVSSLRGLEDNIRNLYESMPAESSETPSTESGNMAVISGEKMQEVVENSVLTSSQQKNESMEVEEGQNPQVAAAPSDNAEISFWQVQKLPGYKEDMKKMLEEGLPSYEVKALTAERLTELLGKVDEGDLKSESNRDVITRLLASKIENSRENQLELAKKCKEYIDSLTKVFESLDESYYMDLICSFATFKSYLDLKSNYLDNFASYLSGYEVWEIKSNDHLKEVANVDEVNAMKAQRRWKIKNLTALDKLIKNIIKLKNANDSKKIWGLKDKYEEALKSKKPEFVEKTPKANKRKHKNLDEPAASDLKELETETLQSLKKMKLNSAKTSTVKGAPGKASVSKAGAAVQNNTEVKQPEEASNSMSQEDSKKVAGKESAKKVVNEKEKEKEKKDNNQKNLMNFFKKKPAESTELKAENKVPQAVQTSRFRCLGSLAPRAVWNEARAEAFENVFAGTGEQLSISELLAQARDQQLQYQQKHSGKTRKIFISLHDSCKRIKGKYDTSSRMIHGRNPLVKDEAVIDYNIDSEEEMQEQNAENIDEDRPSDNNESDLDEEDEEDFIVPDGYVSPIEKPEDGSDDEEKGDDKNHIRFKEDLDFKAKPKAFFFSMIDDYEAGKDWQLDDYLNNFKIIKLVEEEYPLKPKKAKENLLTAGKTKHNPEAINDDDIIRELLLSLHGELSKPDTVKKINAKFPSCSKNSVERKISEFETGELIKKDKLPGETKARWIIQKEFFLKYGTEDEYKNILAEKQEKELERQKLEKEKREAEKKLKQMTQALEQSELKKANKENEDDNEKENSDDNKVIFVGGKKTVQTELPFAVPKDTESTVMNVERSLLQSFPEKMEILDSTPRTDEAAQPNQIEMENV